MAAGCTAPHHHPHHGRDVVYKGYPGSRDTVDGIDFWEWSVPSRKFEPIGTIEDDRLGSVTAMASLPHEIAGKAKAQGADVVIVLSSESKIRGHYTDRTATTAATAAKRTRPAPVPITWNHTRFGLIRYLD